MMKDCVHRILLNRPPVCEGGTRLPTRDSATADERIRPAGPGRKFIASLAKSFEPPGKIMPSPTVEQYVFTLIKTLLPGNANRTITRDQDLVTDLGADSMSLVSI